MDKYGVCNTCDPVPAEETVAKDFKKTAAGDSECPQCKQVVSKHVIEAPKEKTDNET